jgi:hypothetical protein
MKNKPSPYPNLDQYIKGIRPEFEAKLAALVEIPSISMNPENKADCERCAALAVEYLRGIGAEAEAVKTAGNPVVVGSIVTDRSKPTVAIYNHLDAVHVPQSRRPLRGARDDGRQRPGARRPPRRALRGGKQPPDQHQIHLGTRRGERQPQF